MNTRHSLGLTVSNIGLVLKVLFYTAILLLIGVAIFVSVSNPILTALDADMNLATELRNSFNDFFAGNRDAAAAINNGIKSFFNENSAEVVRAAVLYLILFIVMRLGVSFSFVPISFVLYNKMSANFNSRYFNAAVAMAGKAGLYALTYTAFTVPVDIAILIAFYFLSLWFVGALGWIGLLLATFITISIFALRISVTGRFIPLMICENISFKETFSRFFRTYNGAFIKEVFPTFLVLLVVGSGIITTTAVPTVGIIPLLLVPATFVTINSANLVAYFRETKRKYYIDERVIGN